VSCPALAVDLVKGEALLKGDQAGPRGDAAKSPARFEADLAGGGRTSGTQS